MASSAKRRRPRTRQRSRPPVRLTAVKRAAVDVEGIAAAYLMIAERLVLENQVAAATQRQLQGKARANRVGR